MKLQHLLVASLFSLAACGGSKKAETTTPTEATPPPTETAAAPPPTAKSAPVEAPAPPPAPPRFALGEAKISVKLVAKKKGAAKAETVNGEITLAADGTLSATMAGGKEKKAVTGKLTAMGELQDDKGDVIARIDDAGKVEARHEMEVKEDGKLMKSETKYEEVGTLDDTGVFTNKKDGKKLSIDDKGKVVGFPAEMQMTVTAAPAQRKAAMFVMIAMFAATKMSSEASGSKAAAVPAPAPQK